MNRKCLTRRDECEWLTAAVARPANPRCRYCRREIRERDRRDRVIFGTWDAPGELIRDGGCRWCSPSDEDYDS